MPTKAELKAENDRLKREATAGQSAGGALPPDGADVAEGGKHPESEHVESDEKPHPSTVASKEITPRERGATDTAFRQPDEG